MNHTEVSLHDVSRAELKRSSRGRNFWTTLIVYDQEGRIVAEVALFSVREAVIPFLSDFPMEFKLKASS